MRQRRSADFDGENCIDGRARFRSGTYFPTPGNSNWYFLRIPDRHQRKWNDQRRPYCHQQRVRFPVRIVKNDKPFIADDEFTQRILFEIPAGLDSFLISGESLQNSNAVYGNLCFCLNRGLFHIDNGCIKGEKINRSWKVAMNISAQATQGTFPKCCRKRLNWIKNENQRYHHRRLRHGRRRRILTNASCTRMSNPYWLSEGGPAERNTPN